jgi:exonuclease SbcD
MSVKVLHTSDWHLGKTFRETNFDLMRIQRAILKEIQTIVERQDPQIIVIAGDVFDSYNPPFEAERLFYDTITSIAGNGRVVVAIAGNHDSPEKLQTVVPLITGKHSIVIVSTFTSRIAPSYESDITRISTEDGFVKVEVKQLHKTVAINALPFPSEVRMALSGDDFEAELRRNASKEPQFTCDYFFLVSHLFIQGAKKSGSERILQIGGLESIPYEFLPEKADYIALGHLHRYQTIAHATYSGSIYPFDMGEVEDKKGVCLWQYGKTEFVEFSNIPKIKRLDFETVEDAIENRPEDEGYCFVYIKPTRKYDYDDIDRLRKAYKEKLIGWRFETSEHEAGEGKTADVSQLNDEELFRGYYRTRYGHEPDKEVLELFLRCLEEAKHASC